MYRLGWFALGKCFIQEGGTFHWRTLNISWWKWEHFQGEKICRHRVCKEYTMSKIPVSPGDRGYPAKYTIMYKRARMRLL